MGFPSFYNQVKKVTLFDPLADVLGSANNGLMEYSFSDVVKATGHGCPTVAGAYMMCLNALNHLYPNNETPVRGQVEVFLAAGDSQGANGVTGSVFTYLLGAAGNGGFKGLGGLYGRNNLIHYGADIKSTVAFKRLDTGSVVFVDYDPSLVSGDPRVSPLIGKVLNNIATAEEKQLLHDLWNARVQKLLIDEASNPEIYICRHS